MLQMIFLLFKLHVWHAFLFVHCSLVVICWEMAGRLALLYGMLRFIMSFVTSPCGVLGQVKVLDCIDS